MFLFFQVCALKKQSCHLKSTLNSLTTLSSGLVIYFGYGVRHSVQKQMLRKACTQLNIANVNSIVAT